MSTIIQALFFHKHSFDRLLMMALKITLVLIAVFAWQACSNPNLFDNSETEPPSMTIHLDRHVFSWVDGQHPGEKVKVPQDTLTFHQADIQLDTIDIHAAATMNLIYTGNTIRVSTSDNAASPHGIEVIILYEDTLGVYLRAHALDRRSVLTFTESGRTGFSGKIYGFFIHELCAVNEIDDIDFTVVFNTESGNDTLIVNVIDNMVYGNSSFLQSFSQQAADNLFFDYTLSISNAPYYSRITPLAIITVRDIDYIQFMSAYPAPTGIPVAENKVLQELSVPVFGLTAY